MRQFHTQSEVYTHRIVYGQQQQKLQLIRYFIHECVHANPGFLQNLPADPGNNAIAVMSAIPFPFPTAATGPLWAQKQGQQIKLLSL